MQEFSFKLDNATGFCTPLWSHVALLKANSCIRVFITSDIRLKPIKVAIKTIKSMFPPYFTCGCYGNNIDKEIKNHICIN